MKAFPVFYRPEQSPTELPSLSTLVGTPVWVVQTSVLSLHDQLTPCNWVAG